ncbi:MAG: DUF424 domain-containing protein [Nitrososphaerota archaeon]
MPFSVRVANYQGNQMLNICDSHLLGKNVSENDLTIKISRNYYGEKIVEKEEAITLLKSCSIINMVGKETISLSLSLGIGAQQSIKTIDSVPFLMVFKM